MPARRSQGLEIQEKQEPVWVEEEMEVERRKEQATPRRKEKSVNRRDEGERLRKERKEMREKVKQISYKEDLDGGEEGASGGQEQM